MGYGRVPRRVPNFPWTMIVWILKLLQLSNSSNYGSSLIIQSSNKSSVKTSSKSQCCSFSMKPSLVGGWTNPFETYYIVKLDHFPRLGMKIPKNVWNHHVVVCFFPWKKQPPVTWALLLSYIVKLQDGLEKWRGPRGSCWLPSCFAVETSRFAMFDVFFVKK